MITRHITIYLFIFPIFYNHIILFPLIYFIYTLDAIIVLTSVIVFKAPVNILYALVIIYISITLSDKIIVGLQTSKMCYIITDKADIIGDFLIKNSPRGVTNFTGEGVYSKKTKNMLMTVIKRNQLIKLKEWIYALDPNAFVIVSDTTEVLGNGFKGLDENL